MVRVEFVRERMHTQSDGQTPPRPRFPVHLVWFHEHGERMHPQSDQTPRTVRQGKDDGFAEEKRMVGGGSRGVGRGPVKRDSGRSCRHGDEMQVVRFCGIRQRVSVRHDREARTQGEREGMRVVRFDGIRERLRVQPDRKAPARWWREVPLVRVVGLRERVCLRADG